jgi:hypothetical protein
MNKDSKQVVRIAAKTLEMIDILGDMAMDNAKLGSTRFARQALKDMRERMLENHALLWERNDAYRETLEAQLSKKELDKMMKESLQLNPKKEKRIRRRIMSGRKR